MPGFHRLQEGTHAAAGASRGGNASDDGATTDSATHDFAEASLLNQADTEVGPSSSLRSTLGLPPLWSNRGHVSHDESWLDSGEADSCCRSTSATCGQAGRRCWDNAQAFCAGSVPDGAFTSPGHSASVSRPPLYDAGDQEKLDARGSRISPYTQGLVVVNRQLLPEPLFRGIRFINPERHNRLVTEIEYTKDTGDIHYDIESRDNLREDGYARLVTLNWWYQQLFLSLILATVTMANSFSNIIFCVNCFTEARLKLTVPLATRVVFVVLFVVTEFFILRKCGIEVDKEWTRKADPNRVGDLVTGAELNSLDRKIAWLAMFCFKFIHLDAIVKDVVIWLHPWKSVQPYGAFKADGHRCYLVGWASEYMYRCENKQGQEEFLSQQLFLVGILTTFKINVIVESGSFASLILAAPSAVNFFVIAFKHIALLNDRRRHWHWLCHQRMQAREDTDLERAIEKQKSMHFPDVDWRSQLCERRAFAVRTAMAVLIPAALGILMHWYDSTAAAPGSPRAGLTSSQVFQRCLRAASAIPTASAADAAAGEPPLGML